MRNKIDYNIPNDDTSCHHDKNEESEDNIIDRYTGVLHTSKMKKTVVSNQYKFWRQHRWENIHTIEDIVDSMNPKSKERIDNLADYKEGSIEKKVDYLFTKKGYYI